MVPDGRSGPAFRAEYDYFSQVNLDQSNGSYEMQSTSFMSPVYGKKTDGYTFGLGLGMEYTDLNIESSPSPLLESQGLYRFGASINGLIRSNNPRWSTLISLNPSLATDTRSISSKDLRIIAIGGALYQASPDLQWFFGAVYQNNFDGIPFFPGIGFNWQATENFQITFMGPRLNLFYDLHDDWRLNAFASFRSRNWNIDSTPSSTNLQIVTARAGVAIQHQLAEKFVIYSETGLTFNNSIEATTTGGSRLFKEDAETGYFINCGLRLSF